MLDVILAACQIGGCSPSPVLPACTNIVLSRLVDVPVGLTETVHTMSAL
jgi:hypothetical protein